MLWGMKIQFFGIVNDKCPVFVRFIFKWFQAKTDIFIWSFMRILYVPSLCVCDEWILFAFYSFEKIDNKSEAITCEGIPRAAATTCVKQRPYMQNYSGITNLNFLFAITRCPHSSSTPEWPEKKFESENGIITMESIHTRRTWSRSNMIIDRPSHARMCSAHACYWRMESCGRRLCRPLTVEQRAINYSVKRARNTRTKIKCIIDLARGAQTSAYRRRTRLACREYDFEREIKLWPNLVDVIVFI